MKYRSIVLIFDLRSTARHSHKHVKQKKKSEKKQEHMEGNNEKVTRT